METDVTNIRKNVSKGTPSKNAKNGVSLDTSAQLRTKSDVEPIGPLRSLTKQSDKNALLKRARRKYLGGNIALKLVDADRHRMKHIPGEMDSVMEKRYWRSFYCSHELLVYPDGKVTAKYCKQRWCPVCCSIRCAQAIEKYLPIIEDWDDLHFVTLTLPNVEGDFLRPVIGDMQKTVRKIAGSINRSAKRNNLPKLVALRKMECTYNPIRNDYHPHYHFLLNGKGPGIELINRWLKSYPEAVRKAQDIRSADDRSVKEMFKYFTKMVTTSPNGKRVIYADALDVIFRGISGKRTFQPMGFQVGNSLEIEDGERIQQQALEVLKWDSRMTDWVNHETGELLSGYIPSEGIKNLVENSIKMRPMNIAKPIV